MTTLAVDLGGTNLRAALYDPQEGLRAVVRQTYRRGDGRPYAPTDLVRSLVSYLAEVGCSPSELESVGVSVAGLVDEGNVVRRAENVGWEDLGLASLLQERLGTATRVETDVFCGALAELRLGALSGLGSTFYVAVGTGIGHAWTLGGGVWRGEQGAANALGHFTVEPGGRSCYCGKRGCLCQYAAGPVVSRALRECSAPKGVDAEGREGPAKSRTKHGLRIAAGRVAEAERLLARATEYLALAIGQAVTFADPTAVILGGGAISDDWPHLSELTRKIREYSYPGMQVPPVLRSSLGADSNLLGAALLVTDTSERGFP
jgi:glucokinase